MGTSSEERFDVEGEAEERRSLVAESNFCTNSH